MSRAAMMLGVGALALVACTASTSEEAQRFAGTWTLSSGTAKVECGSAGSRTETVAPGDVLLTITHLGDDKLSVSTSNGNGTDACPIQARLEEPGTVLLSGTSCVVEDTTLTILGGSLNLASGHIKAALELTSTVNGTLCSTAFTYDFVTK